MRDEKILEDRDVYALNEFLKRLIEKSKLHQGELDAICKADDAPFYYEDNYCSALCFMLISHNAVTESVQLGFLKTNENTNKYYETNYFGELSKKQKNNDSKSKLEFEKLELEVNKLKTDRWMSKWAFGISVIAIIVSILTCLSKLI